MTVVVSETMAVSVAVTVSEAVSEAAPGADGSGARVGPLPLATV